MISSLDVVLAYLKRNMENDPPELCIKEHSRSYELRFQDHRKSFELSLYCPFCEKHYYHIYISKNLW